MFKGHPRWFRLNLTGVFRILAWTSDENFYADRLVADGVLSRVADCHTRTWESSCGSCDLRTLVRRRLHDTHIWTRGHVFTRWSCYKRWRRYTSGECFSCVLLLNYSAQIFAKHRSNSNEFLPRSGSSCGFLYLTSLRFNRAPYKRFFCVWYCLDFERVISICLLCAGQKNPACMTFGVRRFTCCWFDLMNTTITFIQRLGIGLAIIIITLKCCHESEPFFVCDRI